MKGLAITSMILGIVAIVLPLISCGVLAPPGTILALLGLIFGAVSTAKYSKSETTEGKGMATAGIVLSIIVLAINIIIIASCGGCSLLGLGAAA